jgi:hypothetical protein
VALAVFDALSLYAFAIEKGGAIVLQAIGAG